MTEGRLTLHGLFQNPRFGDFAAAQFQAQLQRACDLAFRFPLNVKTQGRTFLRISSQVGLVCIPIIQAGVEGMAALPVEVMGKNLDDLSRACQTVKGAANRQQQDKSYGREAHWNEYSDLGNELNAQFCPLEDSKIRGVSESLETAASPTSGLTQEQEEASCSGRDR